MYVFVTGDSEAREIFEEKEKGRLLDWKPNRRTGAIRVEGENAFAVFAKREDAFRIARVDSMAKKACDERPAGGDMRETT